MEMLYNIVDVNACIRGQELCECRGGRPGLPAPPSPHGLCGRKSKLNLNEWTTAGEADKTEQL